MGKTKGQPVADAEPEAGGAAGAPSFEDAMAEIETIVGEMEADTVPLDKLLAHYERGTRLVRLCQERLDQAQARIDLIQNQDAGGKGVHAGAGLAPYHYQPEGEPQPEPQPEPLTPPAPSGGQPRAGTRTRKAIQDHDDIRLL